jgi:hypothetical protein
MIDRKMTSSRLAGPLALLLAVSGCTVASPSVLPSAQSASHLPTEPPNTPAPTPTTATGTTARWPYLTDPGVSIGATLVTDGRIYVAESGIDGDARLLAFELDGSVTDGWPVTLDQAQARDLRLAVDGRLLTLACTWGTPGECSLHRLGSGGQEEAGWPATLSGNYCRLVGESDRGIYVGCWTDDVSSVTAIDAGGRALDGWPVSFPALASVQLSTDGTLYVGGSYDEPGAITAYGADGTVRPGWPVSMPPYTYFQVGDDARVYLWSYDGMLPDAQVADAPQCVLAQQTIFSVLTAQGERLPGWPHSIQGDVGRPIEAPDGSLQVAVVDGTRTQLIRLDADTWPASLAGSGAGCWGNTPWIGPDGSVYLFDHGSEGAAIVKADAQGRVEPGWPYRGEFDLIRGESLGDYGVPPAFGPEGAVYIVTYALGDQYFVEVAVRAIGPDGQLLPGWPFIVEPLGCKGPTCYVRTGSPDFMEDGSVVVVASITEESANGQQSWSVIWLLSPGGEPLT